MTAIFERDGHRCAVCKSGEYTLDAHHITNRSDMVGGGYVLENGISLCPADHLKAENYHKDKLPEYSPEELYALIGSSKELAEKKSNERMVKHGSRKI